MREEERGDESIKQVESLSRMPRGAFQFAQLGACSTRADRARLQQANAEREKLLEKGGTRGAS